jgi:hypothetical protein
MLATGKKKNRVVVHPPQLVLPIIGLVAQGATPDLDRREGGSKRALESGTSR